jgi:hypothetical protein
MRKGKMTNIATNANGSITITLPGHVTVTDWGIDIDPGAFLVGGLTGLLVGIVVWIIVRKKGASSN